MGGHHSVSASSLETAANSVVQSTTQTCTSFVSGSNQIVVDGNGDVVGDVTQNVSLDFDASCLDSAQLSAEFEANLAAQVAQSLKDNSVALTQWLDDSKDTVQSSVTQSISSAITMQTLQDCASTLQGKNVLQVVGDEDVVASVMQANAESLIKGCTFSTGDAASAIADAASTANQGLTAVSENPLAFVGDAIDSAFSTVAHSIAAVFIVFLCFLGVFVAVRRRAPAPGAPAPGAPAPAPGAKA